MCLENLEISILVKKITLSCLEILEISLSRFEIVENYFIYFRNCRKLVYAL
jgi:hypothetical protein